MENQQMSLAEQLEELNQYITVGIKNGAGFSEKEKDELWKDVGNIIMPVQIRCISGKMEEMNDLLNCFYYSFSRLYFSRFMLYRGKCERTDMYLFAATVSMHGEICTEEDCILTEKIIDEIPEEDFAPDLLYLRAKGYEEKGDLKNALACLGTISELYKAEKAAEEARLAEQARAARAIEEAKERERLAKEDAERKVREAEERAAREKAEAEARAKAAEESKRREEEQAKADLENIKRVHWLIIPELVACGITEEQAKTVIMAIREGKVPAVSINYRWKQ